jgi:hypothetical protein
VGFCYIFWVVVHLLNFSISSVPTCVYVLYLCSLYWSSCVLSYAQ